MPISLDASVKILLLPLLMVQGVYARRRSEKLPEPPGPRKGRTCGNGPPLALLLTGDSSAAGVGAPHQDQALSGQLVDALKDEYNLSWRVEAKTGATSASTLAALKATPPEPFDVAVVAVGVNDITSGVTLSQFLRQRQAIYTLLRDKFGAQRIVASGLPPMRHFPLLPQPLRWVMGRQTDRFDAALEAQAKREGVDYIHFSIEFRPELMASDGFHPAPEAYRLWARLLARHIRTLMASPPETGPKVNRH